MSQYVHLTIENGVGRLTLNRPDKRNALTREIIEAMLADVRRLANDSNLRAFVLQATGTVFCAGMDLGEMQQRAQSPDSQQQWKRDSQVYCELLTAIVALNVPTIAAVQGPAMAGGMGLVLACDIVIASESASFALPEPMRGITAAMVTPLLVHRAGAGAASYLLLSNEKITAQDSRHFGLCHDVVPPDQMTDRIDQLVGSILKGSSSAFAITKKHISNCLTYDLTKLISQSMEVSARARESDDAREGLAAFLEKRLPSWQPGS